MDPDEYEDYEAFMGGGLSFEDELAMEEEIEREVMGPLDDFEDEDNLTASPQQAAASQTPQAVAATSAANAAPPRAAEASVNEADLDAAMDEVEAENQVEDAEPREVVRCFAMPLEAGGTASLRMLAKRAKGSTPLSGVGSAGYTLLSQPMSSIRDQIDRQAAAAAKAREEAQAADEAKAAKVAADAAAKAAAREAAGETVDEEADEESATKASASLPPAPPAALWVEKYAPKKFVDLLSDERLNRHVLRWVKEWDGLVFGRFPPTNPYGAQSAPKGRPERPLMLISGPPGLGKTTLAHIVAKHAGYRPAEINASDERSAKVLKQRVAEATEVQNVYGDRRPPLIVIDEIDGAMGGAEGTGAINELIKLANASKPALSLNDPLPSGGKGGKGKGGGKAAHMTGANGLMRPVICICNDVHAPALRPLRAVAELVEFRSASNAQLVARLKAVCRAEKMAADAHTLTTLANLSGQDVRTCLNTLQFVRTKVGAAALTDTALESSGIGRKTVAKSPLCLWKQVFTAPPRKHRTAVPKPGVNGANGASGVNAARPAHQPPSTRGAARVGTGGSGPAAAGFNSSQEELLHDLELADVPRVLEGVVENYLSISYTDPSLTRTAAAAECLSCWDAMESAMFSKGHFGLGGYAKTTVTAVHTLCAVPALREQLAFPRTEREMRAKRTARVGLLRSWHAGLAPAVLTQYNDRTLVCDVLSPLITILTPPIKPVALHLLASDERKQLYGLVDIMISFGLRYTQSADDEGTYAYRLDPPLATLLPPLPGALPAAGGDGGAAAADGGLVRELPAVVRQLLGTELQREVMRRHHTAHSGGGGDGSGPAGQAGGGGSPGKTLGFGTPPAQSAKPRALKPVAKPIVVEEAKPIERRDMFGRVISQSSHDHAKRGTKRDASSLGMECKDGGMGNTPPAVRFKYHEGVTDAVRRPVRVRDLL